jgi:hypothetical protein
MLKGKLPLKNNFVEAGTKEMEMPSRRAIKEASLER